MIKRLIKLKISLLYYLLQKIMDGFKSSTKGKKDRRLQVILYHDFKNSEQSLFENQLKMLVNTVSIISVDELDSNHTSGNCVIVTFDDAIESLLETAVPVLSQYNIPATIFVPTAYVGINPNWDGWINTQPGENSNKVMSAEQLNDLPQDLVTLGSHTRTHKNLTRVAESVACNEIKDSKTELEKLLNRQIDYFAFPYGEYNDLVLRLSRESGYKRVFSALPSESDGFLEGRIDVSPRDWDLEFKLKILGYYRWMYFLSKFKQGIVRYLKKIIPL